MHPASKESRYRIAEQVSAHLNCETRPHHPIPAPSYNMRNYSRLAAYDSLPYTGSLGNGTFFAIITVTPSAYYCCCSHLRATFRLKLDSSGPRAKAVQVDYLTADIVDKTAKLTGEEQGDVAVGRPLWVTELCRDVDDKQEAASHSRALFNRGGARRPHLYHLA